MRKNSFFNVICILIRRIVESESKSNMDAVCLRIFIIAIIYELNFARSIVRIMCLIEKFDDLPG